MESDIENENFDRPVAEKIDQPVVGKGWVVEKHGRIKRQSCNYFDLVIFIELFWLTFFIDT